MKILKHDGQQINCLFGNSAPLRGYFVLWTLQPKMCLIYTNNKMGGRCCATCKPQNH